jgi:K+-transporting ATPase ATPase C chain
MLKELKPAVVVFGLLTVLTGAAYPALITGIAQTVFPDQANGSLIVQDGKTVGSRLIGQSFSDPGHFWGRPSATAPMPFNAASSGGSNQGPLNPALEEAVKGRIEALKASDPTQTAPIPVDLVTTSGSGLDPHISVAAAQWQAPRIARLRDLPEARVRELIASHMEGRQLGILGEPRVNVLALNLGLDKLAGPH